MNLRKQRGFSLMEMMVVLLIVAIVAAASAPMVTRKLMRNASGDSPWVYTGLSDNIAYLGGNSGQVLIGVTNPPNAAKKSRLYIAGKSEWSHIAFGNDDNNNATFLTCSAGREASDVTRIGLTNIQTIPNNSIMFGGRQTVGDNSSGIIAIGVNTINNNNSIAIGQGACALDNQSIAIGVAREDYVTTAGGEGSIAIGNEANAGGENSIAIGSHHKSDDNEIDTDASAKNSIAIGTVAKANAENAVAIGRLAEATTKDSIAIGTTAKATAENAVAIGANRIANQKNSVVIGTNIAPNIEDQICLGGEQVKIGKDLSVLGLAKISNDLTVEKNIDIKGYLDVGKYTTLEKDLTVKGETRLDKKLTVDDNVYIKGNLVVDGSVVLGATQGSVVLLRESEEKKELVCFSHAPRTKENYRKFLSTEESGSLIFDNNQYNWAVSDKRLKNIGKEYQAGLEELKKLTFFHYTFKNDENKTPRVGVMAQDLQKVFPNAVVKGEDGYLRIRLEDMFYAVINAIKELDFRYAKLEKTIEAQQKTIEEQAKLIEAQDKSIKEIENELKELKSLLKKVKALD